MQGSPNTRSLFGSVVSYGAASSATLAAVFLLHIIAGRFLGVADYGHFSFALALTTLLAPLLDPGLYYLTIKDVARDTSKASTYLAHALTWKLAFGPFYLGIACTIAYFIHESESSVQTVALLASAVVLHSLKDCFRSTLLALENFRLDAISLGIERLSLLLVAGALLLNGFGLLALCIGYVTVRFLDLIVISRFLTPYVRIRIGTDQAVVKSMLKSALPIGAFYITLNIYTYIDTVMLSWLRGIEEVGWYSAAYRLYEGPVLIPSIIATVFMPRLSRLFFEDRDQFVGVLKQGIQWVVVAAIAIMAIGIAASDWAVRLSYGTNFDPSSGALKILLSGMLFVFVLHLLQTVLIAVDRQRFVFLVAVGGLATNVALNLVLIPRLGFHGAAAATVAVEGLVFALLSISVWRLIRANASGQ